MKYTTRFLRVLPFFLVAMSTIASAGTPKEAAQKLGYADGREFAHDNIVRGIPVNHTVCLAGSKVASENLPPSVPRKYWDVYGAAVYNGCMASR